MWKLDPPHAKGYTYKPRGIHINIYDYDNDDNDHIDDDHNEDLQIHMPDGVQARGQ